MFTKRLLAGLLAALLCFSLVACNTTPPDDSTTDGSTTGSTSASSTSGSTSSQTTSTTQTTGKQTDPYNPVIPADSDDLESIQVGKYVTLRYNANAVDVTATAQKGVGSRETVSVTVTAKNGFTFDGFSKDNALANGASTVSTETTYTFTASSAMKLFVNSSFTLTYHAAGGEFKNGFDGTDTFSAVFFLNPNTLHDNGSFARDGYTLVGYNTKEDGTGEYVSLGAKVTANGNGAINLWCVWEPNTPESDFTVTTSGSTVTISGYKGSAETVTIPETIGGKTVTKIASGAFLNNSTVKKIVVAKTVETIEKNAFNACSALESIVIWDESYSGSSWTGGSISDSCMKNCTAFKSVHINTVYTMANDWFACGASKFDRLMWAKDKKKIIIVGGSGSLYGYDCAVIDEALNGEYEIVNLGENANVTSLMYFDIIEEFITEGDIVLWCPEPGTWTLGSDNCNRRFWDFRKGDYGVMQYLNLDYYSNFFSSFATNCTTLASGKFKNFDSLSVDVSKYGDVLSDRASQNNTYTYNFGYNLSAEDELTELFGNITAKGGTIFFSFAAMEDTYMLDEDDLNDYEEMITSLPGVISISDYENCVYDQSYLWDSAWHLTDEGATLRSEHVAADLLKALGK